jgi:hypothetical protein
MAQLENSHPYGLLALQFAKALAEERFDNAHAMLSEGTRRAMSQEDLRDDYLRMIDYGEGPADLCEVMIVDDAMPKKGKSDLAWVYVAICGPGYSEAVAVTVIDDSGQNKLRIEDWGRP